MNNPALPQAKTEGSRSGVSVPADKEGEKIFPLKAAQPSEKSRFGRESPRKSNSHKRGSSQRNGRGPRKPKRIDRTDVAGSPPRRSQTDSFQMHKQAGAALIRTSRFCFIMPQLFQLQKNEPKSLKRLRRVQN